jgi:hypothetical protein
MARTMDIHPKFYKSIISLYIFQTYSSSELDLKINSRYLSHRPTPKLSCEWLAHNHNQR